MLQRLGDAIKTISVIVLATVVLIAVVEGGAGWWAKNVDRGRPVWMFDLSDEQLRKLYDTDDAATYRGVITEGWGVGIDRRYEPFVEFVNTPGQGRYVNVTKEGIRASRGTQTSLRGPGRKVFVFGGSTAFGMGVRDEETISSFLQQEFDRVEAAATVLNLAVVAYYSTQERVLFERLLNQGIKPEVAVFIDGLNDFYYCAVPDRTELSDRLAAKARKSLGQELAARSNVVKLMRHYSGELRIGSPPGTLCRDEEAVRAVISRLDTNRRMIAAVGREFGVRTLFVQQPVPTYAYDNAQRAVPLPSEEMLGYHRNSAAGYPIMREMLQRGELFASGLLWLADLSVPQNMYVDTVHYSPAFNRAIARAIFEQLSE